MQPQQLSMALLLLAVLLGCNAPAPVQAPQSPSPAEVPGAGLADIYAELARNGSEVFAVPPGSASGLRIYVFRGGAAARMGHNHVLSAAQLQAYASLPSDRPAEARFDLQLRLDQLVVDDPVVRASTGGNFAGVRSASDIEGTQRNMLGPKNMDAGHFPEVLVRSIAIEGDWPMLLARIGITLHGVTREQDVALRVDRQASSLRVRGRLPLRQSDFGVVPYSVLGALLAVQDPVVVEFDLQMQPLPR